MTRAARPLHHQSDCGWPASVTQRKIANLSSERHRHRRLRGSAAAAAAAAARRWLSATETQTRGRCRTFQSPLIYFTHCIYTYSTSSECPTLSLFLSRLIVTTAAVAYTMFHIYATSLRPVYRPTFTDPRQCEQHSSHT